MNKKVIQKKEFSKEELEQILNEIDKDQLLFVAADNGSKLGVEMALQRGADIDLTHNDSFCRDDVFEFDTSLGIAIKHEDENLARYLIEQGADTENVSEDFESTIALAENYGCVEIVRLLKEKQSQS